jgi:short-subunit dehydrogenase
MSNQVVLITGASSGIGKATATKLIQQNFTVYAASRHLDKMQDLAKLGAKTIQLDLTKEPEILAATNTIINEQGRLDILFNNAGFGLYGSVEDTPLSEARQQFEVNLFGLARLTQTILPSMRAQKSGLIINTTSMGGKIYTPLGAWYHATKHALEGWSDCLRLEVQQFGIHVVIIEPGGVQTPWGTIAADHIQKYSQGGPYAKLAQKVSASIRNNYENPDQLSPPDLIADTVLQAIRSPHPKTRYAVGKYAKPLIFLRQILGDKNFDRLILSQIK